jgi:hypothetical protein
VVERTNSANLARQAQFNGEPSRWLLCRKSDAARTKKPRRSGAKLSLLRAVSSRPQFGAKLGSLEAWGGVGTSIEKARHIGAG